MCRTCTLQGGFPLIPSSGVRRRWKHDLSTLLVLLIFLSVVGSEGTLWGYLFIVFSENVYIHTRSHWHLALVFHQHSRDPSVPRPYPECGRVRTKHQRQLCRSWSRLGAIIKWNSSRIQFKRIHQEKDPLTSRSCLWSTFQRPVRTRGADGCGRFTGSFDFPYGRIRGNPIRIFLVASHWYWCVDEPIPGGFPLDVLQKETGKVRRRWKHDLLTLLVLLIFLW